MEVLLLGMCKLKQNLQTIFKETQIIGINTGENLGNIMVSVAGLDELMTHLCLKLCECIIETL